MEGLKEHGRTHSYTLPLKVSPVGDTLMMRWQVHSRASRGKVHRKKRKKDRQMSVLGR